jgi:hypothetical protein
MIHHVCARHMTCHSSHLDAVILKTHLMSMNRILSFLSVVLLFLISAASASEKLLEGKKPSSFLGTASLRRGIM